MNIWPCIKLWSADIETVGAPYIFKLAKFFAKNDEILKSLFKLYDAKYLGDQSLADGLLRRVSFFFNLCFPNVI